MRSRMYGGVGGAELRSFPLSRFEGRGRVSENHFSSCEETVRAADYDRYVAALFARANLRPHLFALYAFNYEIAKTAETISQPIAGQIRLQWWRDAMGELCAGKTRDSPVVRALGDAMQE